MRRNGAHSMAQQTSIPKKVKSEIQNAIEHAVWNRDELKLTGGTVQTIADVASAAVSDLIPKIAYRVVSNRAQIQADDEATGAKLIEFAADDNGNADAVLYLHGGEFLHSEHFGWMAYAGTHWETINATKRVHDAVVDTLLRRQQAGMKAGKNGEAVYKASTPSYKRVRDCVNHLIGRMTLNANADEFDSEDDRINCINGVVNLRSGEIEPHSSAQRFTYCLPTAYNPGADQKEIWAFLDAALEGGRATAENLQMFLGYAIQGEPKYEKFAYPYGEPRAGKGTLKQALENTLGPLVASVPFLTFARKRNEDSDNHELARLRNKRLVICDEGGAAVSLNEERVKAVSGGGRIQVRFLYREPFEYEMKFKVMLISNHDLTADVTDDAFWNRVVMYRFPNGHTGDAEDVTVKARLIGPELREAWLAWLVDGAKRYYNTEAKNFGETAQQKVTKAARISELDTIGRWFADECEAGADFIEPISRLRESYAVWSKEQGINATADQKFGKWLEKNGYKASDGVVRYRDAVTDESKVGRVRYGLKLKRPVIAAGR
jgi:putative DNA primase/helicase